MNATKTVYLNGVIENVILLDSNVIINELMQAATIKGHTQKYDSISNKYTITYKFDGNNGDKYKYITVIDNAKILN